jgi:hypothetical protein
MRFEAQKVNGQSARRVIRAARRNMLAMSASYRPNQTGVARRSCWSTTRFGWDRYGPGAQRMQHGGRAKGYEDGGEGEP